MSDALCPTERIEVRVLGNDLEVLDLSLSRPANPGGCRGNSFPSRPAALPVRAQPA